MSGHTPLSQIMDSMPGDRRRRILEKVREEIERMRERNDAPSADERKVSGNLTDNQGGCDEHE